MIGEPLAHTLARIGVGLFGGMCLLLPLVAWLAHIRSASSYPPQLKKGRSPWGIALFLGFGAACIAFAFIPTSIPTTAYTLQREQTVALFFPVYAFSFIAYIVWVVIEVRKTLAWRQRQQRHPFQIQRLSAPADRRSLPRASRRMRHLSRSR
jgi:hypothetical protein